LSSFGGIVAGMEDNLVVITFDQEDTAAEVLKVIRRLEHEGVMKLSDSAVVAKDPDGKVHVKNEVSSATEVGAVTGAVVGGLLTVFFPVAGIALGAAAGAGIGALVHAGVDGSFVKEVSEGLQPGGSALFMIISHGHPSAIDALKPYKGTVYQTTLPEEVEERLRKAMA
jgi:uncharacterized membrane protein